MIDNYEPRKAGAYRISDIFPDGIPGKQKRKNRFNVFVVLLIAAIILLCNYLLLR